MKKDKQIAVRHFATCSVEDEKHIRRIFYRIKKAVYDLDVWLSNLERNQKQGIKKLEEAEEENGDEK